MIRYSKLLGQQPHGRRDGRCCRCGRGSDEVKTCKNKALIREDRRFLHYARVELAEIFDVSL